MSYWKSGCFRNERYRVKISLPLQIVHFKHIKFYWQVFFFESTISERSVMIYDRAASSNELIASQKKEFPRK